MIAALLLALTAGLLLRATTRCRVHEPRALELVNRRLLVVRTERSFKEAVFMGDARITGECTRCGKDWVEWCRLGCESLQKPVPMPRPPITMES